MNIKPFVDFDKDKANNLGFSIVDVRAHKLKNGFVRVQVSWEIDNQINQSESWEFKKGKLSLLSFSFHEVNMELEFAQGLFYFNVGLQNLDDEKVDYEPLFLQNYGYCAVCYFGSKGWDNLDGAIKLL